MAEANTSSPLTLEMEESLRRFGGFLTEILDASQLPDDHKAAWAVLIPEMTLEQHLRLVTVLERAIDPAKLPVVAELRQSLLKVKEKYDIKLRTLSDKARADFADILKEVEAAEAAATAV